MSWLLRLFDEEYCELQDSLQAENAARIAAEDKIRTLQAELLETKSELARARADTTDSVKHVADWMSQSLFGRKIYSETPDIPEKPVRPDVVAPKAQARRLVNQLEAEFFSQFHEPVQ